MRREGEDKETTIRKRPPPKKKNTPINLGQFDKMDKSLHPHALRWRLQHLPRDPKRDLGRSKEKFRVFSLNYSKISSLPFSIYSADPDLPVILPSFSSLLSLSSPCLPSLSLFSLSLHFSLLETNHAFGHLHLPPHQSRSKR